MNGRSRATGQNRFQPVSRNTSSSWTGESNPNARAAPNTTTKPSGTATTQISNRIQNGTTPAWAADLAAARGVRPPFVDARTGAAATAAIGGGARRVAAAAGAARCGRGTPPAPSACGRSRCSGTRPRSTRRRSGCLVPQSGHCRTGAIRRSASRGRRVSWLTRTSAASASAAAPPSIEAAAASIPAARSGARPATTSAAARVQHRDVAVRSLLAGEHRAHAPARSSPASPPREIRGGRAGQAEVERVERGAAQLAVDAARARCSSWWS